MDEQIAARFDKFEALLDAHANASVEQSRAVNRRLEAIETKLDHLDGVERAAGTLEQVAKTYELAGWGGKALKWVAGLLAAAALLAAAMKSLWTGTPPPAI